MGLVAVATGKSSLPWGLVIYPLAMLLGAAAVALNGRASLLKNGQAFLVARADRPGFFKKNGEAIAADSIISGISLVIGYLFALLTNK